MTPMAESIRIVIADDHPIVREGLATVLNLEEGLEVVGQAVNGLEAVSLAMDLHPDVILMDLQMPEMDGVQAIRAVKARSPEIGIIILTTYETDEHIFTGIEAGARAYLLKDSSPAEVFEAIRAVHKGFSLIQPSIATRVLDRVSQQAQGAAPEQVLSARELEVLQLASTGAANKEIGAELLIAGSTVKTHVIRIFNKLGVRGRTEAVTEAVRRGIIKL